MVVSSNLTRPTNFFILIQPSYPTAPYYVPLLITAIKHLNQLIIDGVATAPLPINVLEKKNDIKIATDITKRFTYTN